MRFCKLIAFFIILCFFPLHCLTNPESIKQLVLDNTEAFKSSNSRKSFFKTAILLLNSICEIDPKVSFEKVNKVGNEIEEKILGIPNDNVIEKEKILQDINNISQKNLFSIMSELKNLPQGSETKDYYWLSFLKYNLDDHFMIIESYLGTIYIFQSFQNEYSIIKSIKQQKSFPVEKFNEILMDIINEKNQNKKVNAIKSLLCYENKNKDKEKSQCEKIISYFQGHILIQGAKLDDLNCKLKKEFIYTEFIERK